MLENLLNLVQQNAQEDVVNNPQIPNEHNNSVMQDVAGSIMSGLGSQLASGNLQGVLGMFSGGGNNVSSNPIVTSIVSSAAGSIASKYGINPQIASSIVASLVPKVMSSFAAQTADPNNSNFDANGILSALTGGQAQQSGVDFNQILQGMQGGQQSQQGGVDLGSIAQNLIGAATSQQQGGGWASVLGSFLK